MYDPLYYLSTYIVFLIVEQLIITYNNNCYDCKQIKTDTCIFFMKEWKSKRLYCEETEPQRCSGGTVWDRSESMSYIHSIVISKN